MVSQIDVSHHDFELAFASHISVWFYMTYTLLIGDRAYSSWSLRGWLVFEKFGIPVESKLVSFSADSVASQIAEHAPARTVPTLVLPSGVVIGESLALAEEMASRHPELNLWPSDPDARAAARFITSEMHSGFGDLREECPMNLRVSYSDTPAHQGVSADLRRLEEIWSYARSYATEGPWLLGAYSIADTFFAPVAARIAGYGLSVDAASQAYVATHLADPAFRRWRAMGLAKGEVLEWYKRDYTTQPWPGPDPLPAQAVERGPSENELCPYSDLPVTHFLKIDDRVFGFCNAFCRDKTRNDPLAWDAFAAIYHS